MNIALIIAGGNGRRMEQEIPKQFLNVNDKPVIIYTLDAFQKHPDIGEIGVVCIDGWHEMLAAYARQYRIDKLKWIVSGGNTGQESIYNGIKEAQKRYQENDLILVHDAIRPMVSQDIITDCIVQCSRHGTAVAAVPCTTAVLEYTDETKTSSKNEIDRQRLAMTQTPQGFPLKTIVWAHEEAAKRGITESVASCTLLAELGQELYFSLGSETNIKLTTQADMEIFRALLHVRNKGGL
jgi:2-C-methyl-D-erythritol 4-phosphate cytidylyltransferase